jgi:beta-xylosidase
MRTELCYRSKNIAGPYEGKIVLQDNMETTNAEGKPQGVAQGGIVESLSGDWYALLFQDHGAVGRIPVLVPLAWKDAWPVFGLNGKVPLHIGTIPPDYDTLGNIVCSDHFDETALKPAWQWNHNPDNKAWSLSARPGWLRLCTGRTSEGLLDARNTLTQRMYGPECCGSTLLDISAMREGDVAGLAALQDHYGFISIKKEAGECQIYLEFKDKEGIREDYRKIVHQSLIYLRIEADFNRDIATFSYSLDNKTWINTGKILEMKYLLSHFTGYRFALFYYSTKETGGNADFDYFELGETATAGRVDSCVATDVSRP